MDPTQKPQLKKMNKKVKTVIIAAGFVIIAALAALFFGFLSTRPSRKVKEDIQRLSVESYNAFFVSMYPNENYNPEDFVTYRGVKTLVLNAALPDLQSLNGYFDAAFASKNDIDIIYLGLDPAALWEVCTHRKKLWDRQLGYLLAWMDSEKSVTFEIMLPYPSLSYWTAMSMEELNATLGLYQSLGEAIAKRPNGMVHFIGAEEWLIANPNNYTGRFSSVNPALTHKLMLLNFCDRVYLMEDDGLTRKLTNLLALAIIEKTSPTVYSDLSDWYLVFFGDSVMTYATDSSSIPGVVGGLSKAGTANLSQGGCPATEDPDAPLSLGRMIDALANPIPENYAEFSDFQAGLLKYKTDLEKGMLENKKLCFVICLGLNDYFGDHPVENPRYPEDTGSYSGALRSGCQRLKDMFPDAKILIMTPSYCDAFSGGTETTGPNGAVLTDYVDAVLTVSQELQVGCANIYADSGIDANTQSFYLADGVHPSEDGRFLIGQFLAKKWGGIFNE